MALHSSPPGSRLGLRLGLRLRLRLGALLVLAWAPAPRPVRGFRLDLARPGFSKPPAAGAPQPPAADGHWPLFAALRDGSNCAGTCGDVAISELKRPGDFHVGCLPRMDSPLFRPDEVPECPLSAQAMNQAGGHVGTFHALTGGRVAKLTMAFNVPNKEVKPRHIWAGRVEWSAYSEMWCLQRLEDRKASLSKATRQIVEQHPLRNFALGGLDEAWAVNFHGICRATGAEVAASAQNTMDAEALIKHDSHSVDLLDGSDPNDSTDGSFDEVLPGPFTPESEVGLFMVIDDMFSKFEQPCQMDLKLGDRTVEPTETGQKYWQMTTMDHISPTAQSGVRLAGYKVWDPFVQEDVKMWSKKLSPAMPLEQAFGKFFDVSGAATLGVMEGLRARLMDMGAWWNKHGTSELRSIALSALLAYECKPQAAARLRISNVRVEGVDGSLFVTARAVPDRTVFPAKAAGRAYADRATGHGFGKTAFATDVGEAGEGGGGSAWPGVVFDLASNADAEVLVLNVWRRSHDRLDDDENIGSFSLAMATASENKTRKKKCASMPQDQNKGAEVATKLCFEVEHWLKTTSPTAPPPVVKLIDFAHFYRAAETPFWPEEGVDKGLMSTVEEISRKMRENPLPPHDAQGMKCNSASWQAILTKPECLSYAAELKEKFEYATWKRQRLDLSDKLGECRLCDALTPQKNSFSLTRWATGGWEVFKIGTEVPMVR